MKKRIYIIYTYNERTNAKRIKIASPSAEEILNAWSTLDNTKVITTRKNGGLHLSGIQTSSPVWAMDAFTYYLTTIYALSATK